MVSFVFFPSTAPTIIIAHEFYDALPVHQFQVCQGPFVTY